MAKSIEKRCDPQSLLAQSYASHDAGATRRSAKDARECTPRNRITAIVLAGGKSSRMGQDKALLEIDGTTLLTKICRMANDCACQTYVVTPWVERYQNILPSSCQAIAERPLFNGTSNAPLFGFAIGMELVETEWVLLLACDLPFLTSSQVKQWSLGLATVLPTEIAYLPNSVKGWEPLCGFYRRNCQTTLKSYINNGGKSFQSWLAQHPVRELPVRDRTCLFNCNTPQDWQVVNSSSG